MVVNDARIVIADTNVVSYELKRDPLAFEYKRLLARYEVRIAFATVMELHSWAEKNGWGARRRLQLRHVLDGYPVLPYSKEIAEICSRVAVQRERAGRPMSLPDAWIAATAIHFGVPVATHDNDFLDTPGLRVISANPEVCFMRDRHVEARRALDLSLRCGCGM